jgi:hypothetical protein
VQKVKNEISSSDSRGRIALAYTPFHWRNGHGKIPRPQKGKSDSQSEARESKNQEKEKAFRRPSREEKLGLRESFGLHELTKTSQCFAQTQRQSPLEEAQKASLEIAKIL